MFQPASLFFFFFFLTSDEANARPRSTAPTPAVHFQLRDTYKVLSCKGGGGGGGGGEGGEREMITSLSYVEECRGDLFTSRRKKDFRDESNYFKENLAFYLHTRVCVASSALAHKPACSRPGCVR